MTTTAETEKPSVPYRRDTGRVRRRPFAFRLPEDLVKKIDRRAAKQGVSRTWLIEVLLNRALGKDADEMGTTEARDDQTPDLFA